MYPIPGNIIGVTNIVCQRRRHIHRGFAIRWSVIDASDRGPEGPDPVSPAVPEEWGHWRTGHRMRRGKPAGAGTARSGEGLVRDEHKRQYADRSHKRSIHSTGHGTYPFGWLPSRTPQTLGRAFGAHKYIINIWLTPIRTECDAIATAWPVCSVAPLIDGNIGLARDLGPALGFQAHHVSELLRSHGFGFGAFIGEKPAELG